MSLIKNLLKPLAKSVSGAIRNEAKKQRNGFFGMLLGTWGASLLENLTIVKGVIRAGEGVIRAGQDF